MEENKEKTDQENIVKITVTKEAGEILTEMVGKANEGFTAGRINRQSLASFIIEKFKANFTDKDLVQLRQLHYDDASMLEAMYRKMKETGEVPEFLKEALRKQFQVPDEVSKRVKKTLTDKFINDELRSNKDSI